MNLQNGMLPEVIFLRKVNCTKETLYRYLCRSQFSHILRYKLSTKVYAYKNVKETDIKKLFELIHRSRNDKAAEKI